MLSSADGAAPDRPLPHAGIGEPERIRDLVDGVGPVCRKSMAAAAAPGRPWLRRDAVGPIVPWLGAEADGPGRAGLRGEGGGPEQALSIVGAVLPVRAVPLGGGGEARRLEHRGDEDGPVAIAIAS